MGGAADGPQRSREPNAYAKDVVRSDFEEAGEHDVIRKVLGDLTAAGVDCDEDKVARGAAQQGNRGAAADHRGEQQLMPMAASEIEALIKAAIPDAEVTIRDLAGDGDHYAARVVSRSFEGLSRIRQHQAVYAALGGRVGGELHALQLETAVPNMENDQ